MLLHLKASRVFPFVRRFFQISTSRYLPYLSLNGEERILEFGCGGGLASRSFRSQCYLGTDVDKERVSYAQRTNKDYEFRQCQETRLPCGDGEFDKVLALAVLHHISDDNMDRVLSEISRVLRTEGSFVAVEPCLSRSRLHNAWMRAVDRGMYIRRKQEYLLFFERFFQAEVSEDFVTPWLFTLSTFRLRKK